MRKEFADLPSDVQAQIRALEALPEDQVDTTDAPEILDWSDARRGVFYRPVKQQITLRLDADIIAWFKAQAHGGRRYQTDINGALREHVQWTARFANEEVHFTTDEAVKHSKGEMGRMAQQIARHWIPDDRKGEASKRLGPVKETVGRRGRCLFVIDENGRTCGEPANNNCHVIPNASVLGNLKDEKTGKVLDLRWDVNSWEHLFLSSSESKPITPANTDSLDPPRVGTGDACVRWFACKTHDEQFSPIDTANPDFSDPSVRFLSVYRAALSAADLSRTGRSILERWDRPILNSPNIPLRVQWIMDRNVLKAGIPRAESFAARLGKIWYSWKTHGELDPDFVSVELLSFRSRLKLAACVSYGNGLEVVAFPVAEDLHRMSLLHLSEDADSVSEDKETLGQLSNASEHGDSYGVGVAEELMTNGRGMVAASPESYDDLLEEDRQTIRRLVARNSRVDRLVNSIPHERNPLFARERR